MNSEWLRAWQPPPHEEFDHAGGFGRFSELVNAFTQPRANQANRFLFRGVPNASFDLRSTLARLPTNRPWLTLDLLHHIETATTNEFRSKCHLVVDPKFMPSEPYEAGVSIQWWQIMQHHGAATRLLDWTASPYVALYYAIADAPDCDGAVWIVDYGAIHDRMKEQYPSQFDGQSRRMQLIADAGDDRREVLTGSIFFRPCVLPTERMVAQRGWFSCPSLPEVDHGESIARAVLAADRPGEWTRKIIVSRDAKQEIARELWQMNITHASLFPGLEGLAQSLQRWGDLVKPEAGRIFRFENGLLSAIDQS